MNFPCTRQLLWFLTLWWSSESGNSTVRAIYYLYYITWFPRGLCVRLKFTPLVDHWKKTLFRWLFLSCRRGNWKLRFQELLLFNNAFNMMRSKSTLRGEILAFSNLSFDQKFNSKAIYESARCCSEDNIKTYFIVFRSLLTDKYKTLSWQVSSKSISDLI